jgi:Ca2+-transporting ATPase
MPTDPTDAVLDSPWSQTAEAVAAALGVDPETGLEATAVADRLRTSGRNLLRQPETVSWWEVLLRQFRSLIVALLAVAAAVSFAFGDWLEGSAIFLVIVINAVIGLVTELRAVRSMEALQKLTEVRTKVRRGGDLVEIPAEGVVPGDVIVLAAGDLISADLRILTASKLQADESAMTGESLPVSKSVEPLDEDPPLADRTNMLFKGTMLTSGSGEAVVVATGMSTELGKISSLIQEAEEEATPLERRLERLGRVLLWATLVIAAAIAGVGIAAGNEVLLMIETAIALAVAAIPEGLPIVATLALARGMWRMAQRNAVIRRLSAVETLGAASVVCTDKTGTLTENRMAVVRFVLATGPVEFAEDDVRMGPGSELLRRALEVGVLCNNADLHARGDGGVGDPLEVALLEAGERLGIDTDALRAEHPEVREEAFDSDTKRMATVQEAPGGGYLVTAKGAPESILSACTSVLTPSGPEPLDAAARRRWIAEEEAMADQGLRVLGLATKTVDRADAPAYEGLSLVGWVSLADPPRSDVQDAIAQCRRAGIDVIMVTGDQPATGKTVAQAVGLVERGEAKALHGSELEALDRLTADDRRRLLGVQIFARVTPKQKLDLISLFQEDGRVVAMTGDGVNDAPALKKADIGVAMGLRGTQVAQEAADMVLQDDAFGTIVEAISQGRAIFDNIRKFVLYLLSCNVSEILAVAIASFAGLPLPLLPLQILFLNLVTDVFPALALGAGEGGRGIMRRPPRPAAEPIVAARHWWMVGGYGGLIAAVALAVLLLSTRWLGLTEAQGTTTAFLTLAFAQLWHVFNMRGPDSRFLCNDVTRNPYIWGALAICTALLFAAVFAPGLATVLKTVDPTPVGWLLVLVGSLVPWVVGQISLVFGRRRNAGVRREAP